MYYVYILKRDKKPNFYIGYTNDLKRRIPENIKERMEINLLRSLFV
ncbi:MAG: GIY-YIG nuclease family protein [Patescibacteria group bacterium]